MYNVIKYKSLINTKNTITKINTSDLTYEWKLTNPNKKDHLSTTPLTSN
jgi:hypothetical protein